MYWLFVLCDGEDLVDWVAVVCGVIWYDVILVDGFFGGGCGQFVVVVCVVCVVI